MKFLRKSKARLAAFVSSVMMLMLLAPTALAASPTLTLTSTPLSTYYTTSNLPYRVYFHLVRGEDVATSVTLKIVGPTEGTPVESLISEKKIADGDYILEWDGKNNGVTAPAGTYKYTLSAFSTTASTPILGSFTVSNAPVPIPVLNNLSVSPNPYNVDNGSVTFGYTLSNSSGAAKLTAGVYTASNTPVKNWKIDTVSNGSNSLVWDGKDNASQTVTTGSYVFKISGADNGVNIPEAQISFTVTKAQPSSCAGFPDVPASDPDCAAITYVKSIGAMTGNANGTFDQTGLLQRDQIAKIVLETFNKFNSQTDYCAAIKPFLDIDQNSWSYQYICRGKALGVITGYLSGADAGYYRPGRSVNRVEFLALLLRNLAETMPSINSTSYSDVATGLWYSGYAKYSKDKGLFTGNSLYPTNFVSREEVARVIYQLHNLGKI
jgi:flagellar hook assembly protein FlgD